MFESLLSILKNLRDRNSAVKIGSTWNSFSNLRFRVRAGSEFCLTSSRRSIICVKNIKTWIIPFPRPFVTNRTCPTAVAKCATHRGFFSHPFWRWLPLCLVLQQQEPLFFQKFVPYLIQYFRSGAGKNLHTGARGTLYIMTDFMHLTDGVAATSQHEY